MYYFDSKETVNFPKCDFNNIDLSYQKQTNRDLV